MRIEKGIFAGGGGVRDPLRGPESQDYVPVRRTQDSLSVWMRTSSERQIQNRTRIMNC
jgi:hypothetical protein